MQYKVIANTTPKHNFQLGTIVNFNQAGLTPETAVFDIDGELGSVQVVSMADVEPVELSKQEAAAKIGELVAEAHRKISEAEALADSHGLDFDFSVAYGMGGVYSGVTDDWREAGWNPSSHSC